MTETACSYPGDRDEALVTYLYDDESDRVQRATFEAHLATCVRCADDLAALDGVRTQLARWAPPEPKFGSVTRQKSQVADRARWREIPAWAQVAAALLFLGVAAGIANLDVRYDNSGLSVRTGWKPSSRDARLGEPGYIATASAPAGTASQIGAVAGAAPWRADLDALARQLKTEFRAAQPAATSLAAQTQPARTSTDAEIVRRVRALVDESERRQQNELALRLAEVLRDVNVQRQADLVKVDRALGLVKNDLGVEVMKNRQQMNYYIRTSQRQ